MEKEMLICYTSLIFCDYFHPKSCLPTIRGNISSCATFCMEFFLLLHHCTLGLFHIMCAYDFTEN